MSVIAICLVTHFFIMNETRIKLEPLLLICKIGVIDYWRNLDQFF